MGALITIKPINFRDFLKVPKALTDSVEQEFDIAAAKALIEFQKTAQTWDKRPNFRIIKGKASRRIEVNSIIWQWVDLGTRPHGILVSKAEYLAFRLGYVAKTIPGVVDSFRGGHETGEFITPMYVSHPGIRAREFSKTIRNNLEAKMNQNVEAAIARALGRIW